MTDAKPMLGRQFAATITTPDLDTTVAAYQEFFRHKVVETGNVKETLANSWGAPAEAGSPYALLEPESGDPVYIRFVESPKVGSYRALRTFGWASIEISVADVDGLADSLKDSPFKILGVPHDLDFNNDIRAMQVQGPAGEILLLTEIKANIPGWDLPRAQCAVDRMFIAILACRDLDETCRDFKNIYGRPAGDMIETAIWTLNDSFGFDRLKKHRITTVALTGKGLLELDQYPDGAEKRPSNEGRLPPGVAMISFGRGDLASVGSRPVAAPFVAEGLLYDGSNTQTFIGENDERFELIGPA